MIEDYVFKKFFKRKVKIMDLLKKIWPTPFKIQPKDIVSLLIQGIIFLLICTVAGFIIGLLAKIAIIGVVFGLIGSLMGLYSLVGLILCILKFFDVVK